MSQQESSRTQARNEDYYDIVFYRLIDLCLNNGFLCSDKVGEVHEEECHDIPYSAATLIKQMVVKFCRNISQPYRNIKK